MPQSWWSTELDDILKRGREIQNETQPSFGAPSGPEKPWWEQGVFGELGGTINQAGQWAIGQAETAKNAINQNIIQPLTTPQPTPPPAPQGAPWYTQAYDWLNREAEGRSPVGAALRGFEIPAETVERGIGADIAGAEAALNKQDIRQGMRSGWEAGPRVYSEYAGPVGGFLSGLAQSAPQLAGSMTLAGVPGDPTKAVQAAQTMIGATQQGIEAGKAKPFHTALGRIQAGEEPAGVLASIPEDPTAEMLGRGILDPLNVVDIPIRGAVEAVKVAKAGERAAAVVSTADEAEDMIARSIAQFNMPQQAKALDPLNPTKWLDASAGTRQRALVEESQDALGNVSGNFRDQLRAIAADPNAAQFTESPLLTNFRDALSSGQSVDGIEAALMPKLLHEYVLNPVRTANELGLGSNALNEQSLRGVALVRQMVTDEAGRVMPDRLVNRMAEAAKAFKDTPEAVADAQLQIMVEEMSGAAKRIYPEAELPGVMAKGAQWRDATNNFFNGLYLGMSPSYAVRNALNNVVTGVVDVGPGMLTTNTANVLADLYPSGFKPKGMTRAFGPTEMSGNLRRATEQKLATARQELTQAKLSNNGQRITRAQKDVDRLAAKVERSGAWKLPGTVLGQKGESSIGGKIWAKKAQEVLPDVLSREVQIPDFVLTGLSPEQQNYLRGAVATTHNQREVMRVAARLAGGGAPVIPDPEALTTLARHNSQWADLVKRGQADVALRQAEQQSVRATENAAEAVATRLAPDVADAVEDLRNVARAGDMDAARLSEFEKKVLANQERVMNARRQVTTHKARQTFGDMIGDGVEQSDTLDRQAFAESRAFRAETWKQYRVMQDAGAPRAQKAELWDNYHAVQDQRFTVLTDRKVQLWNDISTQMKRGGKPPAAPLPEPTTPLPPVAPVSGGAVPPSTAPSSTGRALPQMKRLPETGQFAAVRTDDGSVYFDEVTTGGRVHLDIINEQGIPRERVVDGGYIKDGVYEPALISDSAKIGEQARAEMRTQQKRLARQATTSAPVPRAVDEFADLGTKYKPAALTSGIAKRRAWASRAGGEFPRTAEQWAAVEPDKMRYWSEYLDARAANKGLTPKNHPKYEQWQAQQALPTEAVTAPAPVAPDPQAAIKAKLAAMQPDTAEQQAIRTTEQQAAEAGRASTLQQQATAKMQAEVERKQATMVEAQQKVTDRIAVADIQVDPDRFQFKLGTGPGGITPQLSKVKQWNPALGAGVSVWTDPSSGQTFVVNGHHRVALAKQLGVTDIESPYFIKAPDEQTARSVGALQNIASGRGTAVDAAKFFRDTGMTVEDLTTRGLSLGESTVRDGIALAGLHPSLFGAVTRGEIPVKRGVIIGEKITDADLQFQFVKQLDKEIAKGKKITDDVVAELADAVVSGPKETVTQADMFGVMAFEKSYSVERAQLAAFVRGKLAKDKRLFGMAARNAGELSRVGEIDQAAALGISTESGQLLEIFDRIKNQKGPIGDALNNAAAKLGKGAKINEVENEVYEAIVRDLPETLRGAEGRAVAEPGGARLFGEAEARSGPTAPEAQPGLFGEAAAPVEQAKQPWQNRVADYENGMIVDPEFYDGLDTEAGGKLIVQRNGDGTYTVIHRLNGADIPQATNADLVTARDMARRTYGQAHVLNNEPRILIGQHRKIVEQAIAEGQPVPPKVLADYPDLAAKRVPGAGRAKKIEAAGLPEGLEVFQQTEYAAAGQYAVRDMAGEMASNYHDTPEEAIAEYYVWQERKAANKVAREAREETLQRFKAGDEMSKNDVSRLAGKDTITKSGAVNLYRELTGSTVKDATKAVEGTRWLRETSGGAIIYDSNDILMRARRRLGTASPPATERQFLPTQQAQLYDVDPATGERIATRRLSRLEDFPLNEREQWQTRPGSGAPWENQTEPRFQRHKAYNAPRGADITPQPERTGYDTSELAPNQVSPKTTRITVWDPEKGVFVEKENLPTRLPNEPRWDEPWTVDDDVTPIGKVRSGVREGIDQSAIETEFPARGGRLYDIDPVTGERISRRRYTENPLTDLAQANVDANQEAVSILRRMAEAQRMAPTSTGMTPQARKAFQQWVKQGWLPGVDKARSIAADVATRARDFALLNYGTRLNIDTLLYNFFPFGYWQTHSIPNWIGRIAQHPNIVSNALRFKKTMEDLNKDRPEWYKLNVDVGPLFGVDDPMYVNALQSLMPLYNLVGMDFNDPDRKSMLGKVTQFLGNQGYSVWTPAVWALAFGLYSQGEKDEARSLMGYAAPITKAIKGAMALAGVNQGQGLTVEPYLWSEGGIGKGMDKWDQNRAGVALLAMQQRGAITPEQAQDAAYQKSGDVWDRALAEVMKGPPGAPWEGRALPSLAAWGIGTGFKPRSKADELLYQAQQDAGKLYEQQASMTKEEWAAGWDALDKKYPFYSMTRMAKQTGEPESDTARAWEVLNRLPPGNQRKGLLQQAGITDALVDKFYDAKGDMSAWSEPDRLRMQAGIETLAAGVNIPSEAKQVEYAAAKDANAQMYTDLKAKYGANIQDQIGAYLDLPSGSQERKDYLVAHPNVSPALDFLSESKEGGLLGKYYAKSQTQPTSLKGWAWEEAKNRFGEDIWDLNDQYFKAGEKDSYGRRMFVINHPILKELWSFWDVIEGRAPASKTFFAGARGGGGGSSTGGPPRTREVGGKANRKSYGGSGAQKSWYQQYRPWWLGLRWNVNTRGRA